MQNLFSNLKQKFQTKPITFVGIFILFFVILPIITTLIYFNFRPNKFGSETKINGLDQASPNLTLQQKDFLKNQLYKIIKKNNPNLSNISELQASVVKNSIKKHSTNEINSIQFIIDLPEIKQSFITKINLSKNSPNSQDQANSYSFLVLCPPKDQLIYPDQKCHDDYESTNYIDWKNNYQLDYTLSRGVNTKFKQLISPILLEKFKKSVKNHQISASIDESTLHEINSFTYSFDLIISDSRLNFIIRMDENYGKKYLIIHFSSTSDNFTHTIIATKKSTDTTKLEQWARNQFKLSNDQKIKFTNL